MLKLFLLTVFLITLSLFMMSGTQGIIYSLFLVACMTQMFLKFKLKNTGADEKIQISNT